MRLPTRVLSKVSLNRSTQKELRYRLADRIVGCVGGAPHLPGAMLVAHWLRFCGNLVENNDRGYGVSTPHVSNRLSFGNRSVALTM